LIPFKSADGAGGAEVASTGYPVVNAFWSAAFHQTVFNDGVAVDDVVAHERTHGLVSATANLIYQNESGQLNESYADIFGELADLYNGNVAFGGPPVGPNWPTSPSGPGTDLPNNFRTTACSNRGNGYSDGVRWLIGEDSSLGAIRDMWNPTCFNHPDKLTSPFETCSPFDAGGVHSGSGIPNHAFAMLVDGQAFNGQTVNPIGPIKAGAVWYRALTTYLTPASNFDDAFVALNHAATDLVGTTIADPRPSGFPVGFTQSDADRVSSAVLAVEMNQGPACPGSCCDALAGHCVDGARAATCSGAFTPGGQCGLLTPSCSVPSSGASMLILLDRSANMNVIRSNGHTRCADALSQAEADLSNFTAGQPGRRVAVWTFAGTTATSLTAGFVDAASAQSALSTLQGMSCAGSCPLADAICTALAAFPPGLAVGDKVLAVSSSGGENASAGHCSGPNSTIGPPPPGNYSVGSWQSKVYSALQGQAAVQIRDWDTFGAAFEAVQPMTGDLLVPPSSTSPIDFFVDIAGSTGGNYQSRDDVGAPLAVAVPALPAWGVGVLAMALFAMAAWLTRIARLQHWPEG
jgi:hypothetical protein